MKSFKRFAIPAVLASLMIAVSPAQAQKQADATVVELFTSQGCSSCPPADAFLSELSVRPDIIALSFHVDYWDRLMTFSGRWKDPFSKPEWTQRQSAYSAQLGLGSRVYTPQMVVDGRLEAVGSNRRQIEKLVSEARASRKNKVMIEQEREKDGGLAITLRGDPDGNAYAVSIVRYAKAVTTQVKAGENKGETITNVNIVTGMKELGLWHGSKMTYHYAIADFQPGEGCAVLVSERVRKRIVSAQECLAAL